MLVGGDGLSAVLALPGIFLEFSWNFVLVDDAVFRVEKRLFALSNVMHPSC